MVALSDSLDNSAIFAMPVSLLQAPDYYDVIKHPMDWATMAAKVDRHEYLTGTDFQVRRSARCPPPRPTADDVICVG